jgi:hypothetical protein
MLTPYFKHCRVLLVIGLLLAGCRESPSTQPFEPHIEGLTLVQWIAGDDAIMAINKLHGMPIDVVRGFVAHYEGTNDKATIWVSEASSQALAKEQVSLMIQKMKNNERTPFRNFRDVSIGGRKVIAFDGIGQTHYVFRDNQWVYWISAHAKRIDDILQHICRTR